MPSYKCSKCNRTDDEQTPCCGAVMAPNAEIAGASREKSKVGKKTTKKTA